LYTGIDDSFIYYIKDNGSEGVKIWVNRNSGCRLLACGFLGIKKIYLFFYSNHHFIFFSTALTPKMLKTFPKHPINKFITFAKYLPTP